MANVAATAAATVLMAPTTAAPQRSEVGTLQADIEDLSTQIGLLGAVFNTRTATGRRFAHIHAARVQQQMQRPGTHGAAPPVRSYHLGLPLVHKFEQSQAALRYRKKVAPCILVVDDNRIHGAAAVYTLKKRYESVYFAANGRQALEIMEHTPIDVVLMDGVMPILDGAETTDIIRYTEESTGSRDFRTLIIGMVTPAQATDTGLMDDLFLSGMDRYIVKPLSTHLNSLAHVLSVDGASVEGFRRKALESRWIANHEDIRIVLHGTDEERQRHDAVASVKDPEVRREKEVMSHFTEEEKFSLEDLFARQRREDMARMQLNAARMRDRIKELERKLADVEEANKKLTDSRHADQLLALERRIEDTVAELDLSKQENRVTKEQNRLLASDLKNLLANGFANEKKVRAAERRSARLHHKMAWLEARMLSMEDRAAMTHWDNYYGKEENRSNGYRPTPMATDVTSSWYAGNLRQLDSVVVDHCRTCFSTLESIEEVIHRAQMPNATFEGLRADVVHTLRDHHTKVETMVSSMEDRMRKVTADFLLRELLFWKYVQHDDPHLRTELGQITKALDDRMREHLLFSAETQTDYVEMQPINFSDVTAEPTPPSTTFLTSDGSPGNPPQVLTNVTPLLERLQPLIESDDFIPTYIRRQSMQEAIRLSKAIEERKYNDLLKIAQELRKEVGAAYDKVDDPQKEVKLAPILSSIKPHTWDAMKASFHNICDNVGHIISLAVDGGKAKRSTKPAGTKPANTLASVASAAVKAQAATTTAATKGAPSRPPQPTKASDSTVKPPPAAQRSNVLTSSKSTVKPSGAQAKPRTKEAPGPKDEAARRGQLLSKIDRATAQNVIAEQLNKASVAKQAANNAQGNEVAVFDHAAIIAHATAAVVEAIVNDKESAVMALGADGHLTVHELATLARTTESQVRELNIARPLPEGDNVIIEGSAPIYVPVTTELLAEARDVARETELQRLDRPDSVTSGDGDEERILTVADVLEEQLHRIRSSRTLGRHSSDDDTQSDKSDDDEALLSTSSQDPAAPHDDLRSEPSAELSPAASTAFSSKHRGPSVGHADSSPHAARRMRQESSLATKTSANTSFSRPKQSSRVTGTVKPPQAIQPSSRAAAEHHSAPPVLMSPTDEVVFTHQVTEPTTLAAIAQLFGTDVEAVANANPYTPHSVPAGERIKVPVVPAEVRERVLASRESQRRKAAKAAAQHGGSNAVVIAEPTTPRAATAVEVDTLDTVVSHALDQLGPMTMVTHIATPRTTAADIALIYDASIVALLEANPQLSDANSVIPTGTTVLVPVPTESVLCMLEEEKEAVHDKIATLSAEAAVLEAQKKDTEAAVVRKEIAAGKATIAQHRSVIAVLQKANSRPTTTRTTSPHGDSLTSRPPLGPHHHTKPPQLTKSLSMTNSGRNPLDHRRSTVAGGNDLTSPKTLLNKKPGAKNTPAPPSFGTYVKTEDDGARRGSLMEESAVFGAAPTHLPLHMATVSPRATVSPTAAATRRISLDRRPSLTPPSHSNMAVPQGRRPSLVMPEDGEGGALVLSPRKRASKQPPSLPGGDDSLAMTPTAGDVSQHNSQQHALQINAADESPLDVSTRPPQRTSTMVAPPRQESREGSTPRGTPRDEPRSHVTSPHVPEPPAVLAVFTSKRSSPWDASHEQRQSATPGIRSMFATPLGSNPIPPPTGFGLSNEAGASSSALVLKTAPLPALPTGVTLDPLPPRLSAETAAARAKPSTDAAAPAEVARPASVVAAVSARPAVTAFKTVPSVELESRKQTPGKPPAVTSPLSPLVTTGPALSPFAKLMQAYEKKQARPTPPPPLAPINLGITGSAPRQATSVLQHEHQKPPARHVAPLQLQQTPHEAGTPGQSSIAAAPHVPFSRSAGCIARPAEAIFAAEASEATVLAPTAELSPIRGHRVDAGPQLELGAEVTPTQSSVPGAARGSRSLPPVLPPIGAELREPPNFVAAGSGMHVAHPPAATNSSPPKRPAFKLSTATGTMNDEVKGAEAPASTTATKVLSPPAQPGAPTHPPYGRTISPFDRSERRSRSRPPLPEDEAVELPRHVSNASPPPGERQPSPQHRHPESALQPGPQRVFVAQKAGPVPPLQLPLKKIDWKQRFHGAVTARTDTIRKGAPIIGSARVAGLDRPVAPPVVDVEALRSKFASIQ